MADGFTPPVVGDKPAPGIPASTPPAHSAASSYTVGGTTAPGVNNVPNGANAQLDTPPSHFPDRSPRESITHGQGVGDNDKHKAH